MLTWGRNSNKSPTYATKSPAFAAPASVLAFVLGLGFDRTTR